MQNIGNNLKNERKKERKKELAPLPQNISPGHYIGVPLV